MKAVRRRLRTFFHKEDAVSDQSRHLNLDVLLIIFSYIDIRTLVLCARVCKDWKQAAYHPRLWKQVTVCSKADNPINNLLTKSFGKRNITSYSIYLDYTASHYLVPTDVLRARYENEISALLKSLSSHVKIESLVVISLSTEVERNDKTTPLALTIKLPCSDFATTNLQHLALDTRYKGVQLLLDCTVQLSNLKQLFLKTGDKPKSLFSFDDLFLAFPNLVDLALSHQYYSSDFFDISPKTTNSKLERLALHDSFVSHEKVINWLSYISHHFPNLRHLDIESRLIRVSAVNLPIPRFPALESLRFSYTNGLLSIYYISVLRCFTNCPRLTALELGFSISACFDRFGHFEKNIAEVIELFPKLSLLRLYLPDENGIISECEALVNLVRTMTQLESLVLLGSWKLNESQLRAICDNSTSLNRLVVCWNEWKIKSTDNFPANLGLVSPRSQTCPVMLRKRDTSWDMSGGFSEHRVDIFGTKWFYPAESKVLLCYEHRSRFCLIRHAERKCRGYGWFTHVS